MWNNKFWHGYRSLFLLVRVRSGRFRLTLPLALFLIDETFEILADLLWLVEKLAPIRIGSEHSYCSFQRKNSTTPCFGKHAFSPYQIIDLCHELVNELRRHGRYTLAEVEAGAGSQKQRVSVELL